MQVPKMSGQGEASTLARQQMGGLMGSCRRFGGTGLFDCALRRLRPRSASLTMTAL